jgi:hypothetical protein
MSIYLLALNFIVADKLLGGVPTKIIEHIVINNVLALSWWSATKILYGAGYLAMLPFSANSTKQHINEQYSLVDAAFYNEYIIEHRDIKNTMNCELIDPEHERNSISSLTQLSTDWEIVNKDDNKIILTNNKTEKQIIISKKEIDDMIIITKE